MSYSFNYLNKSKLDEPNRLRIFSTILLLFFKQLVLNRLYINKRQRTSTKKGISLWTPPHSYYGKIKNEILTPILF